MKRRRLLAGVSLVGTASVAAYLGQGSFVPENGRQTRHFGGDVWGDREHIPESQIFEDEASALEKRLDTDSGDEFAEFMRETDFQSEYVALVQELDAGIGFSFTLREKHQDGDVIYLVIDEWPPTDQVLLLGMVSHSIATRFSRSEQGIPKEVHTTVNRHDDRSVIDKFVDRTRYLY